jgi:copper chaperone CopZ
MTQLTRILVLITALLGLPAQATCPDKNAGQSAGTTQASDTAIAENVSIKKSQSALLSVEKMMCGRCRAKVTQTLNKPEFQLQNVKVDLEQKTASFVCNSALCSITNIQKALLDQGYPSKKL